MEIRVIPHVNNKPLEPIKYIKSGDFSSDYEKNKNNFLITVVVKFIKDIEYELLPTEKYVRNFKEWNGEISYKEYAT